MCLPLLRFVTLRPPCGPCLSANRISMDPLEATALALRSTFFLYSLFAVLRDARPLYVRLSVCLSVPWESHFLASVLHSGRSSLVPLSSPLSQPIPFSPPPASFLFSSPTLSPFPLNPLPSSSPLFLPLLSPPLLPVLRIPSSSKLLPLSSRVAPHANNRLPILPLALEKRFVPARSVRVRIPSGQHHDSAAGSIRPALKGCLARWPRPGRAFRFRFLICRLVCGRRREKSRSRGRWGRGREGMFTQLLTRYR